MCDSETGRSDTSDSEYVPSEHSDGDNLTASDDSDVDSETDGGCEAKNLQILNKLPLL